MTTEWRNRPLEVRTFEHCERCKKLAEGVQKRTFYLNWTKTEITSCAACAKEIESEYSYVYC